MKQLFFFLFFLPMITSAQEFSFELYFEDALGNRDTLVLGYDPLATDSIDIAFGEENIIAQPWDSVFEVRISDYYYENPTFLPTSFNSKKGIFKKRNHSFSTFPMQINIKSNHFPITVSCESTLFESLDKRGSLFTSVNPGGWFDTGGFLQRFYFTPTYQVELSPFQGCDACPFNFSYQLESDNIYVSWAAIADSLSMFADLQENNNDFFDLTFSPNPVTSNENITINTKGNYTIVDIQGKAIQKGIIENNSVQLINVESGIYFFILENENAVYKTKFVVR